MNDINSILDFRLDDLADMPSIELFPNGAHSVSLEFIVDNEKNSVRMDMTYIEPVELASPTDVPPTKGDKNVIFFNLVKKDRTPNEYAQGALKLVLNKLQPTFGGANMREVCANSKGAQVVVVTKIRAGKDNYADSINVVNLTVA